MRFIDGLLLRGCRRPPARRLAAPAFALFLTFPLSTCPPPPSPPPSSPPPPPLSPSPPPPPGGSPVHSRSPATLDTRLVGFRGAASSVAGFRLRPFFFFFFFIFLKQMQFVVFPRNRATRNIIIPDNFLETTERKLVFVFRAGRLFPFVKYSILWPGTNLKTVDQSDDSSTKKCVNSNSSAVSRRKATSLLQRHKDSHFCCCCFYNIYNWCTGQTSSLASDWPTQALIRGHDLPSSYRKEILFFNFSSLSWNFVKEKNICE